jgi:hypothetical protein
MRAVLDHSWSTLTEREQELMAALSVFRSGFNREAAEKVTGATLRDLMGLVDKSLLHRTGVPSTPLIPSLRERRYAGTGGRYEMHELTHQYAAEKLELSPDGGAAVRDRHSTFYAAALEGWEANLKSARQAAALEEMDLEIENARAAWDWAAERERVELLDQALDGLCIFYDYRRRGQEIESACKLAAEALSDRVTGEAPRVLARILAWQGWALPNKLDRPLVERSLALLERPELATVDIRREKAFALLRMGVLTASLDLMRGLYEQSLTLYEELNDPWWAANVLLPMCGQDIESGSIDSANQLALEGLEIFQTLGDHRGRARALEFLSNIAYRRNQQEEAARWAREIVAIGREIGDQGLVADGLYHLAIATNAAGRWGEGLSLLEESGTIRDNLGIGRHRIGLILFWTRVVLGQYDQMLAEGERQLSLARKQENQYAIAPWLAMLGSTALAMKTYADARKLLREGVAIMREVGLRDSLGVWLPCLAVAHLALGEQRQAEACIRETLQLAVGAGDFSVRSFVLLGVARLRADQGEAEQAVELYALASRHPAVANGRWFQDVFGERIAAVAATLPPEVVAAAEERGRARDLDATIAELLVELDEG